MRAAKPVHRLTKIRWPKVRGILQKVASLLRLRNVASELLATCDVLNKRRRDLNLCNKLRPNFSMSLFEAPRRNRSPLF
jgi:hypothetical protein